MNLGQARSELESRGYSRFADSRLNAWLNTARVRFEDYQFDWPWLKATATGAAPLTVSDLRRVLSVADSTNRRPLDPIDADDIVVYGTDGLLTTTGIPASWYLSSSTQVSVFPVQAASLSVRYVKFSPALAGDSDTPLIPSDYHLDWVNLAEVETIRWGVKDMDLADRMMAAMNVRLGEIAAVYAMADDAVNSQQLMTGASVDG